jgi:hypothetical protein
MSGLDPGSYFGVLNIIETSEPTDLLDKDAVLDDIEGEKETIPNSGTGNTHQIAELVATLNEVSRGVSDKTHDEYQR